MKLLIIFICLLVPYSSLAKKQDLPRTNSVANSEVYIISPTSDAIVKSPVLVQFGLKVMGVSPAGINKAKTGHHHLIIDSSLKSKDLPIPNDKNHQHFGGGQTEVLLDLKPGKHTLQLVLGDHLHIPHQPIVKSEIITIHVKK